jgi:mannose-6-phosphate isomerase-like protein (cupin superfamily)
LHKVKETIMIAETVKLAKKNLGRPDKTTEFPHGRLEHVSLEDLALARITLQPGWRWSQDVQPQAGTESCQSHHIQYILSGRLVIAMDDGTETELEPGDFVFIPPGHDAWVVGDEPFVAVDFSGLKEYVEES